jgi:hypothetical protein
MFTSRRDRIVGLLAIAILLGVSTAVQIVRDQSFRTDKPAEQVLYVQSPDVVKRLTPTFTGLAADVYWIRAVQFFGGVRQSTEAERHYDLLYPLLNLATSLDPRFNIAYRFGAIFLSEAPPGGPGRPDQAIALLQKGIAAMPEKWQYYQDIGYVHYWARHDYASAAEWFRKGSEVKGAPWWLKTLAAHTLAAGGDRQTSRTLYEALAQSSENDFMQQDARRRLRQLDAMDGMDALRARVEQFKKNGGQAPYTWQRLIAARLLPGVPLDPDGFPFEIGPYSGDVRLNERSTLLPLPTEIAGAARPPA